MSISLSPAAQRDFETEVLLDQGAVRVVVGRLDLGEAAVAGLAAWLSTEELARARRCHFERDRRRFIVARARLRELLGELTDSAPDAVEFAEGEHGKPELGGRQRKSGWHFNLSRCGDVAVYALCHGRRVGIDVEAMREVRGADEIAMHCFSRAERAAWRALDPDDRLAGFLNCWTRKEAFVKGHGAGMSFSYDRFDVSLAPHEPARLLRVDDRPGEAAGWHLEAFAPQPGFVAALVCERQSAI
jgi:4'-phosphopantetheinyl transferase